MQKIQYLVVAALIRKDDKVLLVYKHTSSADVCRGKWEIPGGIAEFGASFEDALLKKAKDYLGVDVKFIRLLPYVASNVSEEETVTKHMYILVGECELLSQDIKLNEKKLSDYKWATFEEAVELSQNGQLVNGDMAFIRLALKGGR